MSYTTVACAKVDDVYLRLCVPPPFLPDYMAGFNGQFYPRYGGLNYGGIISLTSGADQPIDGYESFIDDGTHFSFFSTLTSGSLSPQTQYGGYYTGSKFMFRAMKVIAGVNYYQLGSVTQAYTDGVDYTPPAITLNNVAFDVAYYSNQDTGGTAGPSASGGNTMAWLDRRAATFNFVTASTTALLSREQAFPWEGTEDPRDFMGYSWIYDGTHFWQMTALTDSTGDKLVIVKFIPTPLGGGYNYTKYNIILDNADYAAMIASGNKGFVMNVTSDSFIVHINDTSFFGGRKFFEISKDGTTYREYHFTGGTAAEEFIDLDLSGGLRGSRLVKTSWAGSPRVYGFAGVGGPYAAGTYSLICTGRQGHVYARKRKRVHPAPSSGPLIPSGDMNDGATVFVPAGDANPGGGYFKWTETGDD